MSDTPLKNQIISWLNDRDYWFKYAGNKLLEGEAVTDTLIAETYLLFKEDNGLKKTEVRKTEIVFNKIANDDVPTKTIRLKSINNIDNVNALARNQSIEINPNLTIIYGENGTGKSGYVRLLNNAFISRGDKKMIPNVFESRDTKEPCCNFIFQSDDSNYELEFPEKKDNIEFVQYSVFDSQSVKVHLEEDNKLNFTPSGFEFFEKSIKLYEGVSQKLQEEIADKRPTNEYLKHFNNDNDIKSEITGLGVETDFEKLNVIGSYSESDEESLTEFISESGKLKVLDIPKKMTELQKLQDILTKFTTQQKETSDFLKQEDIESYKSLISLLQKNRNLAAQEGVDSLNAYQIESLSSNEWREFIKASKSYASAIDKSKENEYPSDSDNCLFCLQPLTDKENVLIKSYWKLLKSEAEAELKRTTYKIEGIEKKLKELSPVKFNEATTLFQYVNETAPDLAKKWKDIVSSIEITQKNLITNLSNQNWELPISPCLASISEFDLVAMKITNSVRH